VDLTLFLPASALVFLSLERELAAGAMDGMGSSYGGEKVGGQFKARVTSMPELDADFVTLLGLNLNSLLSHNLVHLKNLQKNQLLADVANFLLFSIKLLCIACYIGHTLKW
jgi:hypothetical protein